MRPDSQSFFIFGKRIWRAINRAKFSIFTVAGVYIFTVLAGMIMAGNGNHFALSFRDQLVNQATIKDPSMIAEKNHESLKAGLLDFSENLTIGAIPLTISGFSVIFPFPLIAYQGWVGGIVSVRGDHSSRFDHWRSGFYYLSTLILQLIPYSLTAGSGINVGIAMFRPASYYQDRKLLNLFPQEALLDLMRIYSLAVPLFLAASLWEFLSPWN